MTNWFDSYAFRDMPAELNSKVFEQLEKAASSGDNVAQFRLACCYLSGWLCKKNYDLAFDLLIKAESQGNALATHKIGNCYYNRWHVKVQDIPKAMEYWTKAAEQGVPNSMHNLGMVHYYNKKDYNKAIEYYTQAAERDFVMSQIVLGRIYSSGKIVKKNLQTACDWYSKAITLGSQEAHDSLMKIIFGSKKSMKSTKNETENNDEKTDEDIIEEYTDEQ